MKLPNFIIIGAMKAGTTSLHNYLGQHMDIYACSRKETNFFAQEEELCFHANAITEHPEYARQFEGAKNEKIICETSPAYLTSLKAPERIKRLLPDVKLLAVIRNPVDRAYSHYLMRLRQNIEHRTSFEDVIVDEIKTQNNGYLKRGFYSEGIGCYMNLFPTNQLKVMLYDEFVKNQVEFMQKIFEFLEIDNRFVPDMSQRHNINIGGNQLAIKTRKILIDIYRDEILSLQNLTGFDLSKWLMVMKDDFIAI